MTKHEFLEGMGVLGSFGGPELDKPSLAVWYQILGHYSLELFKEAIIELCKTQVSFYESNNIAAMIREKAESIRAEERRKQKVFNAKEEHDKWIAEHGQPLTVEQIHAEARKNGINPKTLLPTGKRGFELVKVNTKVKSMAVDRLKERNEQKVQARLKLKEEAI